MLLAAGPVARALVLATWSVQDPSLSHATNAPVRNMLGLTGAIGADLMMQLFGIATVALLLPIAAWGWRLITHRALTRERTRVVLWILGVLVAASFASCLPASKAWPLPTGLGGVVGDWMLRFPALLAGGTLSGLVRMAVAIAAGAGTLVCFAIAAGLGWRTGERHVDDAVDDDGVGAADIARLDHPWLPQSPKPGSSAR